MRRKRAVKRFCKKCGRELGSLNKRNICFRHYTADDGLPIYFPANGSSSGPSGGSMRRTLMVEYGRAD